MKTDLSRELQERVVDAAASGTKLAIVGGGSKSFLGRVASGVPLSVAGHRGIVSYEPRELVLTARAGTPLRELEAALAECGQMMPFEPPHFGTGLDGDVGSAATLGGTVACGLSGPRRPYAGAVRDHVLGVRLLNGQGENLRFGGEVMKNVAGYDLSRLQVGAFGTLGVLLDVSIKVLPLPTEEVTLTQDRSAADSLIYLLALARRALPLSAACHDGDRLYLRLSGAATAVAQGRSQLGGDLLSETEAFWRDKIREQGHGFFEDDGGDVPLWRISVPAATPWLDLPGKVFLDWAGTQRWLKSDAPADVIRQVVASVGGHATLFRGGDPAGEVFHPLSAPVWGVHARLKRAFDPQGLFNPGRMYAGI